MEGNDHHDAVFFQTRFYFLQKCHQIFQFFVDSYSQSLKDFDQKLEFVIQAGMQNKIPQRFRAVYRADDPFFHNEIDQFFGTFDVSVLLENLLERQRVSFIYNGAGGFFA
jgi:hypothetical protein